MSYFEAGTANTRTLFEAITFWSAGIGVLCIWAALSTRHWFVRSTVVVMSIAALLPIRAYEPAFFYLVAAPLIIVTLAMLRNWNRFQVSGTSIERIRHAGWRVSLFSYIVIAIFLAMGLFGPTTETVPPDSEKPSWYEWLAFGSLVAGLGAIFAIVLRSRLPATTLDVSRSDPVASPGCWRFGILDMFMGMIIVGIISGILGSAWQTTLMLDWREMIASAACVALISVMAACFVLLRANSIVLVVAMGLSIAGSAALHTWVLSDWIGATVFLDWPDWALFFGWLQTFKIFLFAFSLLAVTTIIAMYLLVVRWAFAKTVESSPATKVISKSASIALICLCLSIYGPLAIVYCQMMAKLPFPEYSPPDPNGYPQIADCARKLNQMNPQEVSSIDIRSLQSNPKKADAVLQAQHSLLVALEAPAVIPFDTKTDARDEYIDEQMQLIQMFRGVARSLNNESIAQESTGNYVQASKLGRGNVRLGAMHQRGGLLIHGLVGIAIEGIGMHQLGRTRDKLPVQVIKELISYLEAIDGNRELTEITIRREAAWSDETYKWRNTLLREAPMLAGKKRLESSMTGSARAYESATRRRDGQLRLLMTELAIRAFREAESQLPDSLNDLCPQYLSSVPIDPFSGAVLKYRRLDNAYVLYSLGTDGQDNGGKFGTGTDFYAKGYDFDVDTFARTDP